MFKIFFDLDGKIGRVYMDACLEEKKVRKLNGGVKCLREKEVVTTTVFM